jgi:hypothetical protein
MVVPQTLVYFIKSSYLCAHVDDKEEEKPHHNPETQKPPPNLPEGRRRLKLETVLAP